MTPGRNKKVRAERSTHTIGQGGLDLRAGMQCSQNRDRGNGGAGQLDGDVGRYRHQPEDVELECFPRDPNSLEIGATVGAQAKFQSFPDDSLLDDVGMPVELISYSGADEVGAV